MKKILGVLLTTLMAVMLVSCIGHNENNQLTSRENSNLEDSEMANDEGSNEIEVVSEGEVNDILIAYFSWSGNTKVIANNINEEVAGDIFQIETLEAYSNDYDAVVDKASQEQKDNIRPELANNIENIDCYNTIFIGYPNWWGTMPMAVFTFLEEYDLAGKTIIPFCTHEGSKFGRSIDDIEELCPNSTILEGLAIRGGNVDSVSGDVSFWLNKIGFTK